MLLNLHVKNLALIDEAEVNFGNRLNILSGETGAGKSILIGSVNLALGGKADKDIIRNGAEFALVELTFRLTTEKQMQKVRELDLPVEEDNIVVLSRRIQPSRSICRVNGETVSVKQLKELADILIDIHGQHEHQSLLKKEKHLEVLDSFLGPDQQERLKVLAGEYHLVKRLEAELDQGSMDSASRQREISLAEYEIQEIEAAAVTEGEEEELEQTFRKMSNARRIEEAVSLASGYLNGNRFEGAGELISRAVRELYGAQGMDEGLNPLIRQLEDADSILQDCIRDLADYEDSLSFDELQMRETEERLTCIRKIMGKYGPSVQEVGRYLEERKNELQKLLDYDAYRQGLQEQIEKHMQMLLKLCEEVSQRRKQGAKQLEGLMITALQDLNFPSVAFEIQVRDEENKIWANGYDEVEFAVSLNPGEPLKPLTDVASGGELSRIMLALKTVLADQDETDSLIFDEIDTGISGRTAWKVSSKMGLLGRRHQVICITHLPQIAAMADSHFLIEKRTDRERTVTSIRELSQEERVEELGRMLGGGELTSATRENARDMIRQAEEQKIKD